MEYCEVCCKRHWVAKINKQTGLQVKHKNGNKVFRCVNCSHVQEEENPFLGTNNKIQADILYIDIETSKSRYYTYGAKVPSKYLNSDDLITEWFMISWAASYVSSDIVWAQIVTPTQARAGDDGQIVTRLHDLMDSADVIAGHNIDGFDFKRVNTRFIRHGLPPIVDKKTIDTLKVARSKMAWESNKLDFIAQWYGIDGKDNITNADWRAVMEGHKATLDRVLHYNKGDVINGKSVLIQMMPIANKRANYGSKVGKPTPIPLKDKK